MDTSIKLLLLNTDNPLDVWRVAGSGIPSYIIQVYVHLISIIVKTTNLLMKVLSQYPHQYDVLPT